MLATGEGPMFVNDLSELDKLVLSDNKLKPDGYIKFDKNILPCAISALETVESGSIISIVNCQFSDKPDGEWLVEIEKRITIRKLTFIPIRKVLISGRNSEFECGIDEIIHSGKSYGSI